MKLSDLLDSRPAFLRKATLANAAFAYATLHALSRRIETARLRGPVLLEGVNPRLERYAPRFHALRGSQAVLDEHFDETDLLRLADALSFVADAENQEWNFSLEELFSRYGSPLSATFRAAGVEDDIAAASAPFSPKPQGRGED